MTAPEPQLDVFYPIVPDVDWLARVVGHGARTVQLRLKTVSDDDAFGSVERALAICNAHHCQLIVNDHWRAAIAAKATFVHLGQDDLKRADVAAIRAAGIRIGVSTHDHDELRCALSIDPDYVALGPIFETKLKVMPWRPQGLQRLTTWRERIGNRPLVAIGGLSPERASAARAAGADSAAVITDFITADDPDARLRTWLSWAAKQRLASGRAGGKR